jgi:uncharacterized protein YbaR (Trm112 family)
MPDKSEPSLPLTSSALLSSVVDQLACPACLAGLRMDGTGLRCRGCERLYPIVDGIPVLIAEQQKKNQAGF